MISSSSVFRNALLVTKKTLPVKNGLRMFSSQKRTQSVIYHKIQEPIKYLDKSSIESYGLLSDINTKIIFPTLSKKTLIFDSNYNENLFREHDLGVLQEYRKLISESSIHFHFKEFMLTLVDFLIIHANHRLDILEKNKGKRIVENGALIRFIYEYFDNLSVTVSDKMLYEINPSDDLFTNAFMRSNIRNLIRSSVRIGSSQKTASISAAISLTSAIRSLPKSHKEICRILNIDPNDDEDDYYDELLPIKNELLNNNKIKIFVDENYLGPKFQHLFKKYSKTDIENVHDATQTNLVLRTVLEKSIKTNKSVSENAYGDKLTTVSSKYIQEFFQRSRDFENAVRTFKGKLYQIDDT